MHPNYVYPCPALPQAVPSSEAGSHLMSLCVPQGTLPPALC